MQFVVFCLTKLTSSRTIGLSWDSSLQSIIYLYIYSNLNLAQMNSLSPTSGTFCTINTICSNCACSSTGWSLSLTICIFCSELQPLCWVTLTFFMSVFRIPQPSPCCWCIGTNPWDFIGLWTCSAHMKLLVKPLHPSQLLCRPHLPAPPVPAHLLSRSLKFYAPHIRWPWKFLLGPSLEFMLKVCAGLDAYVQGRIWLPSALHELNFNSVVQGPRWRSVEWGWEKCRMWFLFWLGNDSVLLLTMWSMVVVLPSELMFLCLKDIEGSKIKLQDAPKDCGYSVRRNKHGKIQLRFQLHLRCHMSVQVSFDSPLFFIIVN